MQHGGWGKKEGIFREEKKGLSPSQWEEERGMVKVWHLCPEMPDFC